jgi:predicted Zn-dependent protease with MMP-like domain
MAGGFAFEEKVSFECKNCDATIVLEPCKALPLGPFRDRELSDEELDATLPFGEKHVIAQIPLGRARVATSVVLSARTAGQAAPMFEALGRAESAGTALTIDREFVHAMGISRLGPETDAARIANALSECEDDAFASLTNRFLESHYPLRLGAIVVCDDCGARNDVDAPYEREFDHSGENIHHEADRANVEREQGDVPDAFLSFDEFSERANEAFKRFSAPFPKDSIDLVIDDGTPACDDGGEPLLGSYVPGAPGGDGGIGTRPTVTLYVRTFRAMWKEDGPYDVGDEIDETIEHELEHHGHFLTGHDPMDEEERAEIAAEAARIVGKKELARGAARGLGKDMGEFVRRTWPIWLLALVALVLSLLVSVGR